MYCGNCKEKLNTEYCSAKEGLMFYCICNSCKVLNRIEIDLDKNKMVSCLAQDDELDKATRLFEKKRNTIKDKILGNQNTFEAQEMLFGDKGYAQGWSNATLGHPTMNIKYILNGVPLEMNNANMDKINELLDRATESQDDTKYLSFT